MALSQISGHLTRLQGIADKGWVTNTDQVPLLRYSSATLEIHQFLIETRASPMKIPRSKMAAIRIVIHENALMSIATMGSRAVPGIEISLQRARTVRYCRRATLICFLLSLPHSRLPAQAKGSLGTRYHDRLSSAKITYIRQHPLLSPYSTTYVVGATKLPHVG